MKKIEFEPWLSENGQQNHEQVKGNPKGYAFNPYLPSWEYIPDGEPYVFGDRVYIYGSHDAYDGDVFCTGDFMGWSAPIDDLSDWRCEGVIYSRKDEPLNPGGDGMLYAPDVAIGPDGRYYLYYVCSNVGNVSVAVCDKPNGRFEFYGHVHYADGTMLGEREGDEPHFDPGVLREGDKTYLYTGFCAGGDKSRHGAMCTVLGSDMLTVVEDPKFVIPGCMYSEGSGFEGHEYFEAASIRKKDGKYIFVYSSIVMHELCYAVSDKPDEGFRYGGVLISNCDLGIDTYKPAHYATAYGANNHGSVIEIKGQWYIFYHRHTNGTWYSRQVCAERIESLEGGHFKQAELTSCGLNGAPLPAKGYYPTHIACNLFYRSAEETVRRDNSPKIADRTKVRIVQSGCDGMICDAYITDFGNDAVVGFKYFDCRNVRRMAVTVHGYSQGKIVVKTSWDGEVCGSTKLGFDNIDKRYEFDVNIPDGVWPIYFIHEGDGPTQFKGFEFITD